MSESLNQIVKRHEEAITVLSRAMMTVQNLLVHAREEVDRQTAARALLDLQRGPFFSEK
jgi:hypothetical protein